MAQQHLDRLSAIDASFLHQEGESTHMHIGGCALFEGPPPAIDDVLDHIGGRLHLVPRYRQKLAEPPARLGRFRWIDDPAFNLGYHVRHTALPAPGDELRLRRLVARVFSQRLDRSKPLWELWIVEGLADGRWALLSKTHHCLVDGVSGADLMTILFDLTPEPRVVDPAGPWVPRPVPSDAELTRVSLTDAVRSAASLPLRAAASVAQPGSAAAQAREALGGLGEVLRAGMDAAPDSPLNVAIGPHRRIAFVPARLADFKTVKNALGGTVNDVVLAVVAGALRHWMEARGRALDGVELKACVPVSTRSGDAQAALGNQITQLVAPLPLYEADPVARLRAISAAMDGIKDSRQALGAEVIAGMQDFAPPTILAQASRLNFSARFYNLLVTNVPGPQFPLYVLGRRMNGLFPIPFLGGERALAIAVMSYDGGLNFGVVGDYDALADIDTLESGLLAALDELLSLAGGPSRGARISGSRRTARAGAAPASAPAGPA